MRVEERRREGEDRKNRRKESGKTENTQTVSTQYIVPGKENSADIVAYSPCHIFQETPYVVSATRIQTPLVEKEVAKKIKKMKIAKESSCNGKDCMI